MEQEVNAGYIITDRLQVDKFEFVIGESQTSPDRFVTWKRRLGEKECFWGHYVGDRLTAISDLCRRAIEEVEFLQSLQPQPENLLRSKIPPMTPGIAKPSKEQNLQPSKKLHGRER